MNSAADVSELNECGCCEGVSSRTPAAVKNRPGLSAIAYRVGTHAQFKESMLARLSGSGLPALRGLTTRDEDDFSIALLDAWAMVADVLTFYQERSANEFYLRTATEPLSLLALARLIGYELRPGVAASTHLAFTLEDAPGAPAHMTIDAGVKVQSIPGPDEQPQTFETVEKIQARAEWNAMKPRQTEPQALSTTMSSVFIKGTTANLKPGDRLLIITMHTKAFRRIKNVVVDDTVQKTEIKLEAIPIQASSGLSIAGMGDSTVGVSTVEDSAVEISDVGIFVLRTRASLFGYNAPDWKAMPSNVREAYGDTTLQLSGLRRWSSIPVVHRFIQLLQSFQMNDWPLHTPPPRQLNLDTVYPQILPSSWVVVTRPPGTRVIARVLSVAETAMSNYTISTKITQIELDSNVPAPTAFLDIRQTTIYGQSEQLEVAEQPITSPIQESPIELDRIYDGLSAGQTVIVSGESTDLSKGRISEIAVLKEITNDKVRTRLVLTGSLADEYKRDTVTINANVALATHGESVQEVLGSGDAGQPYQRFSLRQPPLTYVTAPTPSGAASTLQVRVNDLLWHEAPTLYGRGPDDRVFVTRSADDGKTTVQFGDGITGARLPGGQENVRASYRKGSGLGGLVKAEQLSLLMTRPLGLKEVINPLAADGADDPESLDEARHNAPLTMLTFDRIVSLQDYADFARAYAGIGKALATWTWDGRRRGVFVTVAGPGGAAVKPDSNLHTNLLAAMQQAGDPFVPLQVASYRQALFRIAGSIKVDPDYQPDKVLAAVEQALRGHFSFEARSFGQPVMLSEVIAVMHTVPGLVAVDLDKLERTDVPAPSNLKRFNLQKLFPGKLMFKPLMIKQLKFKRLVLAQLTLKHRLTAQTPTAGADGEMAAAELLTLDPAPLELGVMA